MKNNLTKEEISSRLHQTFGFSKNLTKNIVNDFFQLLTENFKNNKNVKISSFGLFKVMQKKEREGRNPKTKEIKIISKRRVVTFHSSQKLKNTANKND